uniref:lactosylceramide 4-alpha-galactosyltransferase n=1 Tax=Lonchura striata TaxID=40157 RepID=UPI001293FF4C|nr:lactosylceramide 4-alpha-galactosyltransferase [Lonchura striata domestica]
MSLARVGHAATHRYSSETTQAILGEHTLAGERMLRTPSCLLKLTRVVLSHKPWALFLLIIGFLSFAYDKLYWGVWEDPKSRAPTHSLSAENSCAHYVPSALNIAAGPSPPTGNVFFVETSEQTSPGYLFSCSVESAARTHPMSRVVVLMKGLAKGNASLPKHWAFSLLSCFPNVEIRPLDLVFKKWCSLGTIKSMNCKGVSALAQEVVYPIPWQDWKKLFEAVSALEFQKFLKNTYAVHIWNKLSHGTKLEIPSQALLAQLYAQFCPATYAKMKQDSEVLSRRAV